MHRQQISEVKKKKKRSKEIRKKKKTGKSNVKVYNVLCTEKKKSVETERTQKKS